MTGAGKLLELTPEEDCSLLISELELSTEEKLEVEELLKEELIATLELSAVTLLESAEELDF